MEGNWKKSPGVLAIMLVMVVAAAGLLYHSMFPKPNKLQRLISGNLQESIGFVMAEQASKVLGDKGGTVTLILPGYTDEYFAKSPGGGYERGFIKAAAKLPNLHLNGHFLVNPIPFVMKLNVLLPATQKFPNSDLWVCFAGIPAFSPDEETTWANATHGKMIAMSNLGVDQATVEHLFQANILQAFYAYIGGIQNLSEEPKGDPHEIAARYYKLITPTAVSNP